MPPEPVQRLFSFYFTRLYVHVRPERVYVWPGATSRASPQLFDAHMEEVRSGHDEEPESAPRRREGGPGVWDERIDELGRQLPGGGAVARRSRRLPVQRAGADLGRPGGEAVRIGSDALGVPSRRARRAGARGRACLVAHDHGRFEWQRNFQVRGDLVEEDGGWALRPAPADRRTASCRRSRSRSSTR